jgi:hypothetical protein
MKYIFMMYALDIARMSMFTFIHDQTLQSLTWAKNYMQLISEWGSIIHYRESVDVEDFGYMPFCNYLWSLKTNKYILTDFLIFLGRHIYSQHPMNYHKTQ